MGKYKCTESFSVTKYDENESMIEDEEKRVELGTKWHWNGVRDGIFGKIRLENNSEWLEVSEETFDDCFEKVSE